MALQPVRKARFRNATFTVIDTDADGFARRIQRHEYPHRDLPYAEDLGRQGREFAFEAFTRWASRNELLTACAERGPGKLVHPLLGELDVVCTGCRMRESTRSAGITHFSLQFTEVGANEFPIETVNTAQATEGAAELAREALVEALPERLQPATAAAPPQWTLDSTVLWVEDLASSLDDATRLVPGAIDLATFSLTKAVLGEQAAQLVADPSALASTISGSIARLVGLTSDPLAAFRMLQRFVRYGAEFSAFGEEETRRRDALVRFVRASTLTEAAVVATAIPLDSYNAAAALRDEVVELFEPEIAAAGDAGDDGTLEILAGLRTRVLDDLRARGATLAPVRTLVLGGSVPALVLAYRLYADPSRDAELVARNRIRNPVFMPAGVPLEVLSA